jgi:hypothetical protein
VAIGASAVRQIQLLSPSPIVNDLKNLGRDLRPRSIDGSSSNSMFGFAIMAQQTEIICCSPPDV